MSLLEMINEYNRRELAYASYGLWKQAYRCAYFSKRLEALHELAG